LTLVPLAFSLLLSRDKAEERIRRTLDANPQLRLRAEQEDLSDEELFTMVPDGKIEGAHLAHDSQAHWWYALASSSAFTAMLVFMFDPGKAKLGHGMLIALATGTFGILFLVCLQLVAELTQGYIVTGRSILVILFYIVKLIGYSYRAALDPETGFLLSFIGFTVGVGLCEEITKALPVLFHYRSGGKLDWRGARLWGLASGVGFGVAEGIMYSSQFYNGIGTKDAYLVRFISCVAMHAVWSGAAGIAIARRKAWIDQSRDWGKFLATLLWALAVPIVLHGLYDTLLKKEMKGWAFVAALASFAWLAFLTEWTRLEEHMAARYCTAHARGTA